MNKEHLWSQIVIDIVIHFNSVSYCFHCYLSSLFLFFIVIDFHCYCFSLLLLFFVIVLIFIVHVFNVHVWIWSCLLASAFGTLLLHCRSSQAATASIDPSRRWCQINSTVTWAWKWKTKKCPKKASQSGAAKNILTKPTWAVFLFFILFY